MESLLVKLQGRVVVVIRGVDVAYVEVKARQEIVEADVFGYVLRLEQVDVSLRVVVKVEHVDVGGVVERLCAQLQVVAVHVRVVAACHHRVQH